MDSEELIKILKRYEESLAGILSRFSDTRNSMQIANGDEDAYRRIVLETKDLLNDALGRNTHSQLIAHHFDVSISNFSGSPSYQGVKDVMMVVSAAITRIRRNPNLVKDSAGGDVKRIEAAIPEKITVGWMVKHVPVSYWVAAATFITATFVAGVQASRLSFVKEIFSL